MRALLIWAAALSAIGFATPLHLQAQTVHTLSNFTHGNAGGDPEAPLTNVNGILYGSLPLGGANYAGGIFQLDPSTGIQKVVYSFASTPQSCVSPPQAPLVESAGVLYGILQCAGSAGYGDVFSFDPSTGVGTIVYSFTGGTDGRYPTSLIVFDGGLYGTAFAGGTGSAGTVFRMDPASGGVTILHAFDASGNEGDGPVGLTAAGSALYGATNFGGGKSDAGTLFRIDLTSGEESTLHDFTGGIGGSAPQASPIIVDRVLYGTSRMSGAYGYGAVYKFDINSRSFTSLYSFSNTGDGENPTTALTFLRGSLFGTVTCSCAPGFGNVFEVDPTSGAEKTLYAFRGGLDGEGSLAGLATLNDTLYGTTVGGGTGGKGTVFSLDPVTGVHAVVYSFIGQPRLSNASMIDVGGMLYGTTGGGGSHSFGTLFQFNPATRQQTTLYTFMGGPDDGNPFAALVYSQGTLYGTTSGQQLPASNGTVFSFNLSSGAFKTLYRFSGGADGDMPLSALLPLNGLLYGTTEFGGANGQGTVFSVNPVTGAEAVVYAFTGFGDGGFPLASVMNVGGTLYGTTPFGGLGGQSKFENGVVFKLNPSTGVETPIYAFPGGEGASGPSSQLTLGNGFLYGASYSGWVFEVDLANGGVYSFCYASPSLATVIPIGPYVFGTGVGGNGSFGSLFGCNIKTGAVETIYTFKGGADGGLPSSSLTPTGHGLYGTTSAGGADGAGTIFEVLTK